ncbi:MAG: T9SS type A sorting domain-containing protein [Tannerellaceae bacterium]|jgi:hypothetical protein|nr:T9SS type A sorting domain-containing protein [Tannerellaceae bacterium]
MRKYSLFYLLGIALSTLNTQAQIRHGGSPLPVVLTKSYPNDFFEEMPPFNAEEALRTDSLNPNDLKGSYRFAHKFMTDLNRTNSGTTFTLPDGTRVWMLGIRSKGALSLNVLFTEYELPEGAQVFLYNSSRGQIAGAFNHLNHSEAGLLPVSPIQGDELIIEYQEPAQAPFPGRLTVGEVNHGYRHLRGYEPAGDKNEYNCMPSPVCFDNDKDYSPVSRSTVLLIIDGTTACTGVMVNNTLNDGKPYLLTASHCLSKDFSVKNPDYEAVAGRIVCFFNYTSPACDTVIRGTEEMSVASAIYRAVNEKADMALLELAKAPPAYYQPYYAGWTIEENGTHPPYIGIHHPTASVKRINVYEHNLSLKTFDIKEMEFYRNAHWNIDRWNVGSTAEGSSGSPLFDSANRLTGLLSGGRSTCNSPVDDYYFAFFKAWDSSGNVTEQLKHWLNPSGHNQLTLDGLDPYADRPCYRLSNISGMKLQDSIRVSELPPPATGYLFGINSLKTTEYAEEYKVNKKAWIDGVYLVTPSVASTDNNPQVEIRVYQGNNNPQTLLHSETFHPIYTELSPTDSTFTTIEKKHNRQQESFVSFPKPIEVSGTFYIGYKINASAESSFAVYNLPKGQTTRNTAWVRNGNEWIKTSSHPLSPFSTSLFIDPVVHYVNGASNDTVSRQTNPVGIRIDAPRHTLHLLLPEAERATYRLYSTTGQLLQEQTLNGGETTLSISGFPPGIYVIQIQGDNLSHTQKVHF